MEQKGIDVKALLLKLWAKKYVFLVVWFVTAIVAYGLTYLMPERWWARTEFVVDYNVQEWKNIQAIAWNGRMETPIAPSGSVYSPQFFPSIVESSTFLDELMATPLESANGRTIGQVLLRRDTVAPHSKQLQKIRELVKCGENRVTSAMGITVIAYDAAQAVEIATVARQQLAAFIAADRRQNRLRNLETYERCREDNPTAQILYDMARMELQREEPVLAVVREAEEPFRPESPRRVRITALALILMTFCLMLWYWRKDIPQWL